MVPLAAQRGILGAVLLVALWEGVARGFQLPAYTLPAISQIFGSIWDMRTVLTRAAGVTVTEALVGYALGALIGIGGAIWVTMVPRVRGAVLPAATAFNSVPVIAWSPLVLLWFGMGMSSKYVMVALAIAFTLFLSTLSGLDRVDRRSVDLMRSFGASRLAILWRLRLPTALPLMFAGLRVATARSVLIAVVTEMLGAQAGLGLLIYQAVVQVDFVQVWAAVFVASAASLLFFGIVSFIERRTVFWK
ncbi:ABC transporter permease [Pseudorhodoferax aquiterrae]|uniref:ABC transporter permease n=1 Tax=Pseudorhodoferax aquiterrae TaxID=747304 RepID=A0ABQ3G2D5_9BURK|nr:ABC transporter permease [Pseudorhodoferax aquiterrae]GHC82686.1 ABC transporter permease [Pseudorhodoferax aquiterrae]